jgi:hypothetical protein
MPPLRTLTSTTLSRRLWVGQLAWLLAVFGALAPTVSYALIRARGDANALIEVCTNSGPRWMALGQASESQSGAPSKPDAVTVFEHCPFCLLVVDRIAPPSAALVPTLRATAVYELVGTAPTLFVVTHTDPAPPARGPPVSF